MSDENKETTEETTAQLRDDIEDTRAEMSKTIDAIQDKINPEKIKAQLIENVKDSTLGRAKELAHFASEKFDQVKEKVSEVAGRIGDIGQTTVVAGGVAGEKAAEETKPMRETAAQQTKLVADFAKRNPLHAAGILVPLLGLVLWIALRGHDELDDD